MNRPLYRLIAAFFVSMCALSFSTLHAQTAGAKEILEGKEFYFGIPHCDIQNGEATRGGGSATQLWLSSKVKTLVKVTCPRLGTTLGTYTLLPAKVQIIPVPQALMNVTTGITDNGINVVADQPITVTVYVSYKWTGEAFRVIPAEVLGKRYFTLNLYQDMTERERPGQVLIVGTKDNTTVTFYPKTLTEDGTPAGGAKVYRIHRGQTLLIKAKIQAGKNLDWSSDLTGSKITSSSPVAVFSGHTKGTFPRFQATMLGIPANFMRNMLMDAMWPVEFLGKTYFSAPIKYNDRPRANFDADSWGDLIRIVATEDNTLIYTRTQADADYVPRYPALKAGQELRFENQELACLYKATKPVLIGQYGKAWRSEQVQGTKKTNEEQNPHRNGQGMLFVLTPEEQWSTYTTYHTPDGVDNFTMITFYTADRQNLKFDGVPISAKFGSYIKQVTGTDKSYLVVEVSAGDHTIEGAKFTAYVYGNWDNSKDGFAYGYPTGVNFSQSCPDSIVISGEMVCGVVNGKAAITPDTSTCGTIFSVEMDQTVSNNYTFALDEKFESGMLKTTYTLTPIDIRKNAHAKVIATSRSGKEAVIEFDYVAESIASTPKVVDFGSLPIAMDSCATVKITNTSKAQTVVNDVFLRPTMKEFSIKPGQLPRTLGPGESFDITVCARTEVAITKTIKDSVIAMLSCYENPVAQLLLSGGVPCVQISDVSFAPSPINFEVGPKTCTISNTAKVDLMVSKITVPADAMGAKFRHDLSLPAKILAGQSLQFNVWYKPTDLVSKDKIDVVIESTGDDACSDKISEWTGSGLDAGPKISDYDFQVVRVLDLYNKNVKMVSEYNGNVVLGAFGTSPLQNPRLVISPISLPAGADVNTAFVFDVAKMPSQLYPNNNDTIAVKFRPDFVGDYSVKVTLLADFNGETREAFSKVIGTAVVPIENADGYTWPTPINIGVTTNPEDAIIYNEGTMDLTISNLTIDKALDVNGAFQIDASWLSANLGAGKTIVLPKMTNGQRSSLKVPVRFTSRIANWHDSRIIVDCDLDASQIVHPALRGKGQQNIKVVADSLDFGDVLKCSTKSNSTKLVLRNESDVELTISSITQTGDLVLYEIDAASKAALIGSKIAPRSVSEALTVSFHAPYKNGLERQRDRYDFTKSNGIVWKVVGANGEDNEQYSALAGTAVPTTVLVTTLPLNGNPGYTFGKYQYNVPFNFEFNLRSNPELINDAGVTAFHATITYDDKVLSPVLDPSSINVSGKLCDGWKVRRILPTGTNSFDVELYDETKTKPLFGTGTLFTFQLKGYFSALPQTAPSILGASMYANDYTACINVDNLPSTVTFTPSCVSEMRHVVLSLTPFALNVPNPNPVSNSTVLNFSVGIEAPTSIVIYNSLGEAVLTPVNSVLKTGSYDMTLDLTSLPSGSYFCRMISGAWSSNSVPLLIQR